MASKARTYPLGYAIQRGQVIHNTGNVRPATDHEVDLWEKLKAYDPRIAISEEEAEEIRIDTEYGPSEPSDG